MLYFANAYLTMHEALLSLFRARVCACFISPNSLKATKTIVRGHLGSLFLEISTVLVNYFEFSTNGKCLW